MTFMSKCLFFFTGFRGQHFALPDTNPLDTPDDPRAEPHDPPDFELPDQQALFDAFMAGLSTESNNDFHCLSDLLATLPDPSHADVEAMSVTEARERDLIPEASVDTLRAFSYSEMKLYKHTSSHKCTVDELISTIKLIKSTDLKVEDVNLDLHAEAAMFMRSTYGCGTLVGPSLEFEAFWLQKHIGFAERPGQKHSGALGRPGGPGSVLLKRYDKNKHEI